MNTVAVLDAPGDCADVEFVIGLWVLLMIVLCTWLVPVVLARYFKISFVCVMWC